MQPTLEYTENDLVSLLHARDKNAFKYLYEQYSGALYSVILQIVPGNSMAGDLLQEAFINIWNKFDGYDHAKGRLFTWMLAITRNVCIDMIRSKGFRNNQRNTSVHEENEYILYAQGATSVLPGTMNHIGLKKAVQKLQPQYRELIQLAYFGGYTQAEIAGMEGLPKGTVKTRIRKALLELRQHLQ